VIKKISFIVALFIGIAVMTSCSGAPDEDILAALKELSPKAIKMYEIVYGDVLAHGEPDENGMCVVEATSEFKSEKDISDAIDEVFTDEYGRILKNTAFNGVSTDEGGINPKYYEKDGVLYVCPSSTEGMNYTKEIDLKGAKVVKKNRFMAKVLLPLGKGDKDDLEVTLKFIDGNWKIDSDFVLKNS